MRRLQMLLMSLLTILIFFSTNGICQAPLTIAEQSNFTATSRYEDVVAFLYQLQKQSPLIKITSIGQSAEGRDILLAILGDPVPASPAQLQITNKPAIYVQANIHAGEVEGKEAMLMLMRDILTGSLQHLLDNQVLLITPIYNADGNEKISKSNRRNQLGPKTGVGVRYNGQHLDLNRDYMKLESPENLAAAEKILNQWDPLLLMDLHTTNGSYHQEPLTYATAHNPNGDASLPDYMREKLFPAVTSQLKSKYNIMSLPYGFFVDRTDPGKGWGTFNHQPHYSTNYWGLRNRFAILDENYAYADYETRIRACYHFVELVLEYTNKHGSEMLDYAARADAKTVARGLSPDTTARFGIQFEVKPFNEPLLIHSYEFETYKDKRGRTRVRKTDQLRDYSVPFLANFQIKKSVPLPKGYFFSSSLKEIAQKLLQHGIILEQLCEPVTAEVQIFEIHKVKADERLFQGHRRTSLEGSYRTVEMEFPKNTYFVGMDQPLANLAAYLLEPESDGGLVRWNFMDRYFFRSQWGRQLDRFPVFKLLQPLKFAKRVVNR